MVQLSSEQLDDLEWDAQADVIVVGSGAAGYAGALSAASRGASVIILEAADDPGGTTAKSGGTTWIPGNALQEKLGLEDDRVAAMQYLARLAYPDRYHPDSPTFGLHRDDYTLLDTFTRRGREAVDFLIDLGALCYQERLKPDGSAFPPYPDYQSKLPESRGIIGRSMSPGVPEGAHLPDDFLSEGALLPGGMIMIETMRQKGEALGVDLRLGHRVVDVLVDESGRVVGVMAHVGRRTVLVGARRGVMFGSGGFLMNRVMADQFLKGHVAGGCSKETNVGDFVKVASKLGAQLGNMSLAWWTQTVLELSLSVPSALEAVWYPYGDSMIQVNKYGRRVVNERQVYNERGQVHFEWDATKVEYPNTLLFQIYDEHVASDPLVWPYRGMTPMPGEHAQYVISGATLPELVDNISARLSKLGEHAGGTVLAPDFIDVLQETIDQYNQFAEDGVDQEFGRGEEPIQVLTNGPGHPGSPNPTMAPLSRQGPYYCIIMAAGAIDTKGGPRIDSGARVLDVEGQPIPGLFGAGNCVSSPFGQAYPGAGGSIGAAMTFGYIAGQNLAS